MKKYNVVVAKPDRNDPEKVYWKNCGTLLVFEPTTEKPEPGYILELNMFPTTDFKVFAATEKKPERVEPTREAGTGIDYPKDDIDPFDIPF
jgi:hypothetical protein